MEIKDGNIIQDGKVVGTALRRFRYGYHPSIKVNVGEREKWFELDTPNLIAAIKEFAGECLQK